MTISRTSPAPLHEAQAPWIAAPWRGGARTSAVVPCLRKSFTLTQEVRCASLRISSLGVFDAKINGRAVTEDVFAPGWTDYHQRIQVFTYDVTDLLRVGENAFGAMLGDGWYCGFVAWQDRQVYGERPWLFVELTIHLGDGSVVTIPTDATWKVRQGPILESDMLMGEAYDARLELGAWTSPDYDDSTWFSPLCGNPHPDSVLISPSGPPIRRIQEIAPVGRRDFPDGDHQAGVIMDFGQNFTGRVRIKTLCPRGTTLRLRYAEMLDEKGNLYTDNLRGARATDTYTCRGGGDSEIWEPYFTFHGFRYLEVIGFGARDALEATGIVLHSQMKQTGFFHCSNPLLNQLQSNILWGQKSNFLDVPTDCPQRDERLGWTGDAQVFIRTAAFNMDVRGFFEKWMQDVRDAQHPSGAIPCVAPMSGFLRHIPHADGGPAWSDANIICPWTLYLCYNDKKILQDHYASMKSYLAFLGRERSLDFIRSHPDVDPWGGFGDWLALDGSAALPWGNTPKDLIGTAFYAYDASIMASVAGVLGHSEDAAAYRTLHQNIVGAFRRRFVTPDGFIASDTQTAYVLALKFDLVPEETRSTCARGLVRLIERSAWHLTTGFVGTPYLLDVLEKSGHLDIAYRLLEQETYPSWLFSVKNGATTIWERWNGWTPEGGMQDKAMNSFNHYAFGAVGAWMYETIAGLSLDESAPGYRRIIFHPRPGGSITWAVARLETAFGMVGIHWELKDDHLQIQLTVPEGAEATLIVPPVFDGGTQSVAPGRWTLAFSKVGSPTSVLFPDRSTQDEENLFVMAAD